ncbi:MAG: ribonuclease III family protein [Candidatus Heimdallarchaeaceae archaeon]
MSDNHMVSIAKSLLDDWKVEKELLDVAFTHPNHTNEHSDAENFERLEYLGDAVLSLLTAEWLYENIDEEVGILSMLRSLLVQTDTLADIGNDLELKKHLITSPKYKITKTDIEDCLEAIFGAVYQSTNIEKTKEFYYFLFKKRLEHFKKEISTEKGKKKILKQTVCEQNPINLLQEYFQKRGLDLPEYSLEKKKGKQHDPQYFIRCKVALNEIEFFTIGKGRNRKNARKNAAEKVLKKIEKIKK